MTKVVVVSPVTGRVGMGVGVFVGPEAISWLSLLVSSFEASELAQPFCERTEK